MKMIIGKKLEMSQKFREDGTVVPVTLIYAPANHVIEIKSKEKGGYEAVQLGAFVKKNINKAEKGHLGKLPAYGVVKEFRFEAPAKGFEKGQDITVKQFESGEKIDITGTSKGKGFQGVVKRHGFHGHPASHGHKDQLRMSGSIGAKGVARVFKGTRMGGRMGNEKTTVKNLEIINIDEKADIIAVKGAIPGARNSLVYIKGK